MKDVFDIERLSKLAYLELSSEEKEMLKAQMPRILEYIGKLQEVDTSNVEAKAYLSDRQNVFRDDVVEQNETERARLIDSFPNEKGGALQVPAVFE